MASYKNLSELVSAAEKENIKISQYVLNLQAETEDKSTQELFDIMQQNFNVMKDSIAHGINSTQKSPSGLTGGDAHKLQKSVLAGTSLTGGIFAAAVAKALAVSEYNACMGRIVAAPTAGSSGIIPAILVQLMETHNLKEQDVVMSLFTAGAIGVVISTKATLSGAEGGCQAECGSAAAMAAGAAVELMGGSPSQIADACSIAINNSMGLVCDPVAGLVEIPCVMRNAGGVANALTAAEMVLAGIKSLIPADEVIDAMGKVGKSMPPALKETAGGGVAVTPTAKRLAKEIFG